MRDDLAATDDWSAGNLENRIKAFCDAEKLGLGKVAQPLRVAISGTAVSPPIFDCLAFLGREKTLARVDHCLASLEKN